MAETTKSSPDSPERSPLLESNELSNLQETLPLKDVMSALGIDPSYERRYEIIQCLFRNGKILFDGSLNEYQDPAFPNLKYIGNISQNGKLKRNIIRNRDLFVNGNLSDQNAKKWVIVD